MNWPSHSPSSSASHVGGASSTSPAVARHCRRTARSVHGSRGTAGARRAGVVVCTRARACARMRVGTCVRACVRARRGVAWRGDGGGVAIAVGWRGV
eukprot:2521209-Prymnesium_polylepis.1